MIIFVPTRGRMSKQVTRQYGFLDYMRENGYEVKYIVPECDAYRWVGANYSTVPDSFRFSDIRQAICRNFLRDPLHVCMDDDLYFFRREDPKEPKLRKAELSDCIEMFQWMEGVLETTEFKHGAISGREGNNHVLQRHKRNTRAMRCHFYDARVILDNNLKFTDVAARQDFHMTLSLLELGYPNLVNFEFAQNQAGGSNTKGGCSRYRTPEMLAIEAEKLRALHPDFVKVVEKETLGSWGGGKRIDVQIAWKKAAKAGGLL